MKKILIVLGVLFVLFVGLFTYNQFFKKTVDSEDTTPPIIQEEPEDDGFHDNSQNIQKVCKLVLDKQLIENDIGTYYFSFDISSLEIDLVNIDSMFLYGVGEKYDTPLLAYYSLIGSVDNKTGEIINNYEYDYDVSSMQFERFSSVYFVITTNDKTDYKTEVFDTSDIINMFNNEIANSFYFNVIVE